MCDALLAILFFALQLISIYPTVRVVFGIPFPARRRSATERYAGPRVIQALQESPGTGGILFGR